MIRGWALASVFVFKFEFLYTLKFTNIYCEMLRFLLLPETLSIDLEKGGILLSLSSVT